MHAGGGEFGIPQLRVRTDNTEEAREWNRMREAVLGLYEGRVSTVGGQPTGRKPFEFEPIVRRDPTEGVGMVAGKVLFHQVPVFYATAGTDNEAIEVWPTLGGTALNSATPPRSVLAAGDWEAWLVYSEEIGDYQARIEFTALGTGAGTLARDEKAHRLCTFEVVMTGASADVPNVRNVVQFISHHFEVWTDWHPFRVVKTGTTTVRVEQGNVQWYEGTESPIVTDNVNQARSGNITVSGTGSIWLDLSITLGQLSQSSVTTTPSPTDTITLTMYRIASCSSSGYTFRTARPTPGSDGTLRWHGGSIDLHVEIAEVALESGEVVVTNQIVHGPIWLSDYTEGELTQS